MNTEVFLENIDLVSEASNGIDSLRKHILYLAVQGKLFQHDIEKSTGYPLGWKTLPLDEVGDWGSGSTPLRGTSEYYGGDIPWFKSGELNEGIIYDSEEKITKKALAECSLRMNKVGDVLIAMYGATVGKTAIMGVEGTTNQAVCACTCNELINNKYLLLLFKGYKDQFISMGAGAAQPNISKIKIVSTVVPIPPIGEQKRIIARVDQLMTLCDELETKQEKQTHTRSQLNDAALNALLSAASPEEFEKHWRRIVDNFDLLYDDLENLQSLRRGILTLAVQGKLTSNKDNSFSATLNSNNGYPFIIPSDWEWLKLGDIANKTEYGTSYKSEKMKMGVPVLRMGNIQNGVIDFSNLKYVSSKIDDLPKLFLKKGDILFNRTNSYELVGKTGIYEGDYNEYTFASYLIRIEVNATKASSQYVNMVMNSSYYRKTQIEPDVSQQCGQANFNGTKLSNTLIPVPTLAEQKRIVTKVDQLLALCDELEKKLTAKSTHLEKLTESLLRV